MHCICYGAESAYIGDVSVGSGDGISVGVVFVGDEA